MNRPPLSLVVFEHVSPHLTPAQARTWAEAASVLLEKQGHGLHCQLALQGDYMESASLDRLPVTAAMRSTHADDQDATADGAYAMALVTVKEKTGHGFLSRTKRKGPGFDHYLSKEDNEDLQGFAQARLEVSGILNDSAESVRQRVKEKRLQLDYGKGFEDQGPGIPLYIGVAGFKTPLVWLEEYQANAKGKKKSHDSQAAPQPGHGTERKGRTRKTSR